VSASLTRCLSAGDWLPAASSLLRCVESLPRQELVALLADVEATLELHKQASAAAHVEAMPLKAYIGVFFEARLGPRLRSPPETELGLARLLKGLSEHRHLHAVARFAVAAGLQVRVYVRWSPSQETSDLCVSKHLVQEYVRLSHRATTTWTAPAEAAHPCRRRRAQSLGPPCTAWALMRSCRRAMQ
jgi:hypothetical protein